MAGQTEKRCSEYGLTEDINYMVKQQRVSCNRKNIQNLLHTLLTNRQ